MEILFVVQGNAWLFKKKFSIRDMIHTFEKHEIFQEKDTNLEFDIFTKRDSHSRKKFQ